MTDTGLAVNIQPTPFAGMLKSARVPHELAVYRGVLTPRELDAPETEIAALAFGAALHDLGWLSRVAVRGEDRFRWLSGMVTNTVNDLFPNSGAWNLVLNAQGRIQGDLTVWRGSEETSPLHRKPATAPKSNDPHLGTPFAGESGLELEIAADQYEKLMAHFNRFIIMDDVELIPVGEDQTGEPGSETAVGLAGPLAGEVLQRLNLPVLQQPMSGADVEYNGLILRVLRGYGTLVPHYTIWVPVAGLAKFWPALTTAGATPVGSASLEAFRIAEAIPTYGIDIAERDLPQETSQMRALHFNKGCYLGQEIVERIRSRGAVHRHLRPLEIIGPIPAAGAELTLHDGKPAGTITSSAALTLASGQRTFALAVIRAEAEVQNQTFNFTVGSTTGTARILASPPAL